MTDKEAVVRGFLRSWGDGDARKLADFHSENAAVWNDARTTVRGREAIHEHYKLHLSVVTDCVIEVTALVVSGDTVFTERVDRMKVAGADLELPVAGVFEVDEAGKITAWRDYFDLLTVMEALKKAGVEVDPQQIG